MIRPLYRWKSFWFGVLVIAFLGWAWVRSVKVADTWTYGFPSSQMGGGNEAGTALLYWYADTPAGPGLIAFARPWVNADNPPVRAVKVTFSKELREIKVRDWFLNLLFLVPWSGWLAWRWRRIKRLATAPLPSAVH